MIKDIIIAIDGNSGCGKSTTSRLVAKYFNYKCGKRWINVSWIV